MDTTDNKASSLSQKSLQRLFETAIALSAEQNIDILLEQIVSAAKELCHADGGTLYLLDRANQQLFFSVMQTDSLGIKMGGTSGQGIDFPPLYLYHPETGEPNWKNVATYCILADEIVNIDNAYATDKFDFSGTKKFDEKSGYHSTSFLTLPLKTRTGETVAVLQLLNALSEETGEVIPFSKDMEIVIEALGSYAAVAIDNQLLADAQRNVLESFLAVLAQTIDEKSPHLGGHCQQVPAIARMLALAADSDTEKFGDFSMSDDDWYAFHLASWMHDCGRIITPKHLEEKSAKLETVYNRIHEIRQRFEILRRDAHIVYLKKRLEGKTDPNVLLQEFALKNKQLQNDFAFLAECNLGTKTLQKEDIDRLNKIAQKTYHRYFNKSLGLSDTEKEQWGDILPENPQEALLDSSLQGELYPLSVSEGIFTPEEQQTIDNHVTVTSEMLNAISFPKNLKSIVEIASAHHEKVDGTGFPNGLKKQDMSIPARILAIADYFELISARNRPRQKVLKMKEILTLMHQKASDGTLDPDLFNLFLTSGVYQEYAEQYMDISQLEAVDITKYLVKAD